jgi:hypothetical protein
MNCIENLPVYGAIVVALTVAEVRSPLVDGTLRIHASRANRTDVDAHRTAPANASASLRFALFFVQLICMFAMSAAAGALAG